MFRRDTHKSKSNIWVNKDKKVRLLDTSSKNKETCDVQHAPLYMLEPTAELPPSGYGHHDPPDAAACCAFWSRFLCSIMIKLVKTTSTKGMAWGMISRFILRALPGSHPSFRGCDCATVRRVLHSTNYEYMTYGHSGIEVYEKSVSRRTVNLTPPSFHLYLLPFGATNPREL